MSFLLDTCTLSDPTSLRPNAGVRDWYSRASEASSYVSVLSIGEIRKGLAKLGDTQRATRIATWLEHDLIARFGPRILDVDREVATLWGTLCGQLLLRGRPQPVVDGLIAATALVHDLTLVTRNVSDFRDFDVKVINPWL